MAAQYVAYGPIDAMVAEVGAFEMPKDWLTDYGYTHCVMIVGDEQYDTEYLTNETDAKDCAAYTAEALGVPSMRFA